MENVALLPVVAGALIDSAGRVLVQRRPAGGSLAGLWEFPGGKVEAGEAPEAALIRELGEELGIEVRREELIPVTFTTAALGERHLLLLLYRVARWSGEPRALHADTLRWVGGGELAALAMPAPDVPLVAALRPSLAG